MDETPKHTNRLVDETSPYLLQHAHNPVDWYPWGEEALQRARSEDKPILLSIGYSACHWCHVMERESFENEQIAKLMNDNFINIKVDREERPDLDEIYMSAVQAMTGSGGWPMTMFLTPDLKPFYGGTYFPPTDQYGRPGFPRILTSVAETYQEKRGEVADHAEQITKHLQSRINPEQQADAELSVDLLDKAFQQYQSRFDERHGGFGQAPKFPPGMGLSLLLRYWKRTGNAEALQMVEFTLEKMANGGMYDQLGGGFHRYSVDEIWLVPHFEKMLYDNSLLTVSYLEAYQATGKDLYQRIARETLDYVLREMYDSQNGGFYSTQDADSEGEEGKFFVWTPDEVAAILPPEQAKIFCDFYDITEGGNFEHKNILHVRMSTEQFVQMIDLSESELIGLLEDGRAKLFTEREKRIKPGLDDKILTSWNGLMIRSMALGYQILGDDRYLQAASKSANFIHQQLSQEDGLLWHTHRAGKSHLNAYLEDYAYLICGLIELYQASFDLRWLKEADRLSQIMIDQFWDITEAGFFFTGNQHEALIIRSKSAYDGATPSGTSMALHALVRLAILLDRPDYRQKVEQTLRLNYRQLDMAPSGSAQMMCSLDFLLGTPSEIAIVGLPDQLPPVLQALHNNFIPNKVVAWLNPDGPATETVEEYLPLLTAKTPIERQATIYICQNYACQQPTINLSVFNNL